MEAEPYFLLFYAGIVSIVPTDLISKKSFQPTQANCNGTHAGFFSIYVQSLLSISLPFQALFFLFSCTSIPCDWELRRGRVSFLGKASEVLAKRATPRGVLLSLPHRKNVHHPPPPNFPGCSGPGSFMSVLSIFLNSYASQRIRAYVHSFTDLGECLLYAG